MKNVLRKCLRKNILKKKNSFIRLILFLPIYSANFLTPPHGYDIYVRYRISLISDNIWLKWNNPQIFCLPFFMNKLSIFLHFILIDGSISHLTFFFHFYHFINKHDNVENQFYKKHLLENKHWLFVFQFI